MKITRGQVDYVARLARLRLSREQEEKFTVQLNKVLEYMEKLNHANTQGIEPVVHAIPIQNTFREDEPRPSLPKEKALDNAPAKTEDFFLVHKVI